MSYIFSFVRALESASCKSLLGLLGGTFLLDESLIPTQPRSVVLPWGERIGTGLLAPRIRVPSQCPVSVLARPSCRVLVRYLSDEMFSRSLLSHDTIPCIVVVLRSACYMRWSWECWSWRYPFIFIKTIIPICICILYIYKTY